MVTRWSCQVHSRLRQYTYAFDRLAALARDSWDDPAFQDSIADFPDGTRRDAETLLAHVADLTSRDVKAVYLKQLQGGCSYAFHHMPCPVIITSSKSRLTIFATSKP